MKAYTYQIGSGEGDAMAAPAHSESLFADSLGEAILKAKAITNHRPVHDGESQVRIVEGDPDQYPVWASSVEDVRNG